MEILIKFLVAIIILITILLLFPQLLFYVFRLRISESYFVRNMKAEPSNPKWPVMLGTYYSGKMNNSSGKTRQDFAIKAVSVYERWLTIAPNQAIHTDYSRLQDLAKVAFVAEDYPKAEKYALMLMEQTHDPQRSWDNTLHVGNTILGRLALKKGDRKAAKKHLRESGKVSGSPQLESFGPSMALAQELLDAGETKTVLEYLQLCKRFWSFKSQQSKLDNWIATIQQGKQPDFGKQLKR